VSVLSLVLGSLPEGVLEGSGGSKGRSFFGGVMKANCYTKGRRLCFRRSASIDLRDTMRRERYESRSARGKSGPVQDLDMRSICG
jgi:hypothetical protein